MRRPWLMLLAIALAGCSIDGLLGPGKPGMSPADRSVARYGGLQFGPLSSKGANLLGGGARAAVPMVAPVPSGSPPDAAQTGVVGEGAAKAMPDSMPGMTVGSTFMSSPLGPMKLDRVTEASAPGAQGSLQHLVDSVVQPVLDDWAQDAALVSTAGDVGADGQDLSDGTLGWSLNYVSPSHNEGMAFHVSSQETRVLFLSWVPVPLDLKAIRVDSAVAVRSVQAAVRDAQIKSREEVDGQDFFLKLFGDSGSGGNAVSIAPAPPPALTAPTPVTPDGPPEPSGSPLPPPLQTVVMTETLTDLPPGGRWSVQLNPIGSYLVWQLAYYATGAQSGDAMRYPPQEGDRYSYSGNSVSALVDVRTGDLLRIQRPTKTTVTWVKGSVADSGATPKTAR